MIGLISTTKEGVSIDTTAKILTPQEQVHLTHHEERISAGLKVFRQVAESLVAIRIGRLYRAKFGTFEQYCDVRWGMTARYARRILSAAEVIQGLENGANCSHLVLPATESQARPLGLLPPEQQATAWAEAVATAPGGNVTAKHVQAVIDRIRGQHVNYPEVKARIMRNIQSAIDGINGKRTLDAGTRTEQIEAAVDAAIARTRDLLDAIGTADSVATTEVWDALQKLDNFKSHLEHVAKLQESRL